MILRRREAVTLSSFFKFLSLSIDERNSKIENALVEISLEIDNIAPQVANYYARKYIERRFSNFTNSYLQTFLSDQLGKPVTVKGRGRSLESCICCGYKTLDRIGWDICKVCFWQDDGNSELTSYSGVNHLTLFEAKENFKKFGVMLERFKTSVDPDRMIQYERSVE